jgi:putative endopeptidase
MKSKLHYALLGAASLTLMYACSPKTGQMATTTGKNTETPAGRRKFIDPANMNTAVKPSEDFYEYANGAWLKTAKIPASESRWGSFNELQEFNQNALKAICEDASATPGAKGTTRQKVGDFYAAGMDEAAIEKMGLAGVKPLLDRVMKIKTYKELLEEITNLYIDGDDPLWSLAIDQDDKNSTAVVPKFYQGGIHLPDRDYFLKDDERSKKIRKAYEEHAYNVFKLLGDNDVKAKANAGDVMRFETTLAKASMTRVEMRNPEKMYNKMTLADLEKVCPQMNWAEYMKKLGIENAYVIVGQPEFLKEINTQLKNGTLDDWKTILRWNVIKSAIPYLNKAFVEEGFKFAQNLTGQKEMQPRWKRVSNMTDGILGEALGQIYVEKHFKPEAKQRMMVMVENLSKTYEARIKNLDWMSATTKQKALQKLSTFIRKIGYTDKWKDYTPLSIDRSKSYFENVLAAKRFLFKDVASRVGKPVDKTRWGMTPSTVNAYYNPSMNEIVFPAGILQYPFFDNEADDAVNYGGIGAVIGHEMTHGFDDEGRQFDFEGNLKEWWTEEDSKKFDAKANLMVEQYNGYTVLDTVHVNGKLTLGENLADLGGVTLAYEAFKNYSAQGKTNDRIDGFTPDQRFFLSWSQVWRNLMRDEAMAQRIVTDPHSPGRYRSNGPLSNFEPFYKAFDVKEGDKMWRPEAKRVKIW